MWARLRVNAPPIISIRRLDFYRDSGRAGGLTGRSYLYARSSLANLEHALRFSAITRAAVRAELLPEDHAVGAQGWFINTRRAKFFPRGGNTRVREEPETAVDFRVAQQAHHVRRYVRTHLDVPEFG